MKKLNHPFFDLLKDIAKRDLWNAFEGAPFPKREFYSALREAHPFVFDSHCTDEGMCHAGIEVDHIVKIPDAKQEAEQFQKQHEMASAVEEFSLPFATSLYLLTNCPTIVRNASTGPMIYKRIGYLLKELGTPEKVRVFDLMTVKTIGKGFEKYRGEEKFVPVMDFMDIDLKNLNPNLASDTLAINRLTNMMSVKRIGIEKRGGCYTLKTKGIGAGFTTFKYDNIVHIADKEEYEYAVPLADEINYEHVGWWRGHWRAFYFDSSITDQFGRRIVDYSRVGKNREGTYNVPGYTWVVEHIKGDPTIAEIKTRTVKHG